MTSIFDNYPWLDKLQFCKLVEQIADYGTEGGAYGETKHGGVKMLQHPTELALLVCWLKRLNLPYDNFLEIGIAHGGTSRALNDLFKFKKHYAVDNNQTGDQTLREENLKETNINVWIGDSHSVDFYRKLLSWETTFDLVHIDGDHSYEGALQDLIFVGTRCHFETRVFMHDTEYIDGPKRLRTEIRDKKLPILKSLHEEFHAAGGGLGITCFTWEGS